MASDLTVGQYFPGHSLMHRLDPRVKISLTLVFIVMVFLSRSAASLTFLLILLGLMILCSGVSVKQVYKGIKPVLPVILLTAVVNIFYVQGHTVFSFYWLQISAEGLYHALTLIIRLTALIAGSSLITFTTSLTGLAAGFEQLLAPLNKFHLKVSELSLMITIAIRFLPALTEEVGKIIDAQKARGAQIGIGGPVKRIKSYFPVILPLFMSAFRRAFELSNAIECRCYRGGEGRTKMNALRATRLDLAAILVFSIAFLVIIGLNFLQLNAALQI